MRVFFIYKDCKIRLTCKGKWQYFISMSSFPTVGIYNPQIKSPFRLVLPPVF